MDSRHWNYDVKENNYTSSSSFPSKITLQITSIIHTAIQKQKRAKKFAFNQALALEAKNFKLWGHWRICLVFKAPKLAEMRAN